MPLDQRQRGLGQRRQRVEANGVLVAGIPANPAAGALPGVDPIARLAPARFQGNDLMGAQPRAGIAAVATQWIDGGAVEEKGIRATRVPQLIR
jgi:hypothetical protein